MGVSGQGIDGSRYARYVGRVGALAVALGVGAAVATGQGLGLGIARADESGAGEGSASAGSSADPSSPDAGDQAAAPTPPAGSDHSDDTDDTDDTDADAGDADGSGMNVGSSGGADTSVNDEGQSTDTQTDPDPDEPESGDDSADAGGDDVTTAPDATPVPGPHAGAGSASGAPNNGSSAPPDITPNQKRADVKSDTDGDTASTTTSQTSVPAESRMAVTTGGSANLTTLATTVDEPALSTTQQQEPLLSVPDTEEVGLASTLVAALLAPFVAPGPTAPAGPPLLWAMLEWVRREVARTFFNQTPVAVADPVTTSEDTPRVIDVLANDTDDFEQDSLAVTGVTQPANGTVVINPDGTLTYTPKANFAGTDTFSYTISDAESPWHLHGLLSLFTGQKHTATATVTVTVGAVNDAPAADNDAYTVNEDGVLTVSAGNGVLNGDTDIDNTAAQLSAVVDTGPAHGTLGLNADGSFTYTPVAEFHGTDTFTYKTSDGVTTSNLATVTISVTQVHDAPGANDDTATVAEGGTTTVNVLTNDTDPDGNATIDATSIQIVTQPGKGSVTVNADGTITYESNGAEVLSDSFSYTVKDAAGAVSNTATVTVTITPVNDGGPAATGDAGTVAEGATTTISVLANDTDPDGDTTIDATSIQIVTQPGNGSVTVNTDGTITYQSNGAEVLSDSFSYIVKDAAGAVSNIATVTVTITPVNDAPVAGNPAFDITAVEHTVGQVTGDVNVTDQDPGDGVTYSLANPVDPAIGAVTVNATTGVWRFTPTAQARLDSYTTPGDQTVTFVINATDGDATTAVTVMAPIDPDPLNTYMWDTFPVGASPQFAVSRGDRLYVAAGAGIYVIDTTTDKVIDINPATEQVDPIEVGGSYATIDGDRLYVSSGGAVTVIDLNSNSVVGGPIDVGTSTVRGIVVSGNRLYASSQAGIVHVVDLTTNTVVGAPISVGARPTGMAASGKYIYVVNSGSDSVSVIDTATNTVVGTPIPVGTFPGTAVVSGNRLFVANIFGNSLSVIDTTTNTLIDVNPATTAIDAIRVGASPTGMAVRGDRLYVAQQGPNGVVTVVDTNTFAVVQSIRVRPGARDIAVAGNKIYVTSSAEGTVTILISLRPV